MLPPRLMSIPIRIASTNSRIACLRIHRDLSSNRPNTLGHFHAKPLLCRMDNSRVPVWYAEQPKRSKTTSSKDGKKKDKSKAAIDKLLEDIDSDEEDDARESNKKMLVEEELIFSSPVAKFIHDAHRGGKRKGDGKGTKIKGKGSNHYEPVSYVEAKALVDIDDYWTELQQQLETMKQHFIHHLTLRSATALDDLPIELEGDVYPLHELASLSKKDPKQIIIDCSSFPQATSNIVKAIQNSGMNLNPQQEGTRICVPIPKVTKEYREKLAKGAKARFQEAKEDMRKVQSKYVSIVNDRELQHAGPKDQFHAVRDVLLAMNEHFAKEAEAMMLVKQQELMGK